MGEEGKEAEQQAILDDLDKELELEKIKDIDKETQEIIEIEEDIHGQKNEVPNKNIGESRGIHTKLVGQTFRGDGQQLIRSLRVGQSLLLIPEPENKFDPNAIKVCTESLTHLGYIKKELAAEFKESISKGTKWFAEVTDITGGEEGKENLGCNILIKKYDFKEEIMKVPSKIYALENKMTALRFKIEELKLKKSQHYETIFKIVSDEETREDDKVKRVYTNEDARKFETNRRLQKEMSYQASIKELEDKTHEIALVQNEYNYEVNMFRAIRSIMRYKEDD